MKKIYYLILLIMFICNLILACQGNEEIKEIPCADIDCKCEKGTEEYYKNDNLERCWLARPTVISDYPCASNEVFFYDTGELWGFWLNEPYTIRDIDLGQNTYVTLYRVGNLQSFWMHENIVVDDFRCRGNVGINFYETGQLQKCQLYEDMQVGNYMCASSVGDGGFVSFYESGHLEYCQMKNVETFNGIPCMKQVVYLYDNGNLKMCNISEEVTIGNKIYPHGSKLCFDENTNLITCPESNN